MAHETAFAHSCEGVPPGSGWHPLEDHLRGTASRAQAFTERWGGARFAYLAGLWHDLGKYAPDWQDFLLLAGQNAHVQIRGPDHSSAGAVHATAFGPPGLPVQFAIAGHHAGLADRQDLRSRLAEKQARYQAALVNAPPSLVATDGTPGYPVFLKTGGEASRNRGLETFIRMIFSALVDADFLDTEEFYESAKPASERRSRTGWPLLSAYASALDHYLSSLETSALDTRVNAWRRRVQGWCRTASEQRPGAFSLTVPTGGGKTLSSLVFALRHALIHGLDRVIVALPFTSILDQTASTFRDVFTPQLGENVLVEHHSAVDPIRETALNRLASENWDAPLVITTQVQLFDSLFSNRTSRCRKLHNIGGSVVILDEVQTLPAGLLAPILDQLQQLVANYGSTFLLMTATQPSLHARRLGPNLFTGFDPPPREIVPASAMPDLFNDLRRVVVHWPSSAEPMGWPALASAAMSHDQVMIIVHRRADAAALWRALRDAGDPGAVHLSALMCPAHRREVLAAVRGRLRGGAPCRLVSTQLVEAGVDVDFPIVYRAMAGLESLAQAAGRCNREGLRPAGDFHVFNAPTQPPPLLRHHREVAEVMLELDRNLDLMAPATFRAYFDRLYAAGTDGRAIQPLREALCFEQTAQRFSLIDEATEQIVVAFGQEGRRALDRLRYGGPSRGALRALQPFMVPVYPWKLQTLRDRGDVASLHDLVNELVADRLYDAVLGLQTGGHDLGPLIV